MIHPDREMRTKRLLLRTWCPSDIDSFAGMHADPDVMADLGGPVSREESRRKLRRYDEAYRRFGYSRWCVEDRDRGFVGYVGVFPRRTDHPLGSHDEIGWRLNKAFWGKGLATEAAAAAMSDAFGRVGLARVLSYTTPANVRSQAVICRLPFDRRAGLDFTWRQEELTFPIMVWESRRSDVR